MTPTISELRELAPGYVMGTLTLEERHAFDAAMTNPIIAAELSSELAALRVAVEYLATSHSVAPPPSLRDRVAARIAEEKAIGDAAQNAAVGTADLSARARDLTSRAPSLAPTVNMPAISGSSSPRNAARRGGAAGWWTAGALVLALAASLLFVVDLRNEAKTLRTAAASQTAALTAATTRLAQRERLLATVLGSGGDVTLVRLQPSQPQGPGMQVFWNIREGKATVTASGLAPIARDRAYALWMIRLNKPVAIALFTPDSSGRAVVQDIAVPTNAIGVAAFAVTEEPSGGSAQPTMTPFLVGEVPKR